MDEQTYEPKPVGPLGAAFAELVEAPPPSSVSALSVLAAAGREASPPRRLLSSKVLISVAAAAVGVSVLGVAFLGVRGSDLATSTGGALSTSAEAAEAAEAAGGADGADRSVALDAEGGSPGEEAAGTLTGGPGFDADGVTPGDAAPPPSLVQVACAELPLAEEHTALVLASFPEMAPAELPEEFCGRLGSPVGYGEFSTPDGRRVIVRLAVGAQVPENCEPVAGPAAALRCADGDWVTFLAIVGDRIAAVDVDPGALATLPEAEFATLADALLAIG